MPAYCDVPCNCLVYLAQLVVIPVVPLGMIRIGRGGQVMHGVSVRQYYHTDSLVGRLI